MRQPNSMLLYVADPRRSAEFYQGLFGGTVPELSDNFALVTFATGFVLGLWARKDVSPTAPAGSQGFEVMIHLERRDEVDEALAEARRAGARVLQEPVELDFGYTWLAEDPDGHRLRAYYPSSDAPS